MTRGWRLVAVGLGWSILGGCEFGDDLTAEQLSSVVEASKPALISCYQEALNRAPKQAELQMQVELKVAPTGEVSEVSLRNGEQAAGEFKKCIRGAVLAMRFPEADIPTHASLPLIFEPKEDEAATP